VPEINHSGVDPGESGARVITARYRLSMTTDAAGMPADVLLSVVDLQLSFDGVRVLDDVSFTVRERSITSLIGPNGAGKTSLFNCASRFYQPEAGSILLRPVGNPASVDLLRIPAHRLAGLGVARTFQDLALFPSMSVLDNVALGAHVTTSTRVLRGALRTPAARRLDRSAREHCRALLELLDLQALADRPATGLAYGLQKRVELARALASRPRLLLLDEPASGLTGPEVAAFADLLQGVRAELDLTILLIEHHMAMVMRLSDAVVVLDGGRVIAAGTPAEVQVDPAVVEAYLGVAA
jgi:branched-chain amino acid transport system ATP-binding protein